MVNATVKQELEYVLNKLKKSNKLISQKKTKKKSAMQVVCYKLTAIWLKDGFKKVLF